MEEDAAETPENPMAGETAENQIDRNLIENRVHFGKSLLPSTVCTSYGYMSLRRR